MSPLLLFICFLVACYDLTEGQSVGVCYGTLGNNLPSPFQAISLCKSHNIQRVRIYDPNPTVLQALRGSNIQVMLGVPNSDLQYVSSSRENAREWVRKNVKSYSPDVKFRYVAVGNEVKPSDNRLAPLVGPALNNIQEAITFHGLRDQVKVSTAIDMTLIGVNFPPSKGAFRGDVRGYLEPIIRFLVDNKSPLFLNIYPYFSYAGNPRDISLPYATFRAPGVVVQDGSNRYQNLFDAMLDAVYSALEKAGGASITIVVSESGWPSNGGFAATLDNARAYYTNLVQHVTRGTPKRPEKSIETYLFALFDENNKEPQIEKNFGIFYSNQQPKYQISF